MKTVCTSPTLEVRAHMLFNPTSCCNLLWTSVILTCIEVLYFAFQLIFYLSLQLHNLCTLPSVRNCFTSLKVSVSDFCEDNAKCCSRWFVIRVTSAVTSPGWYTAMAGMTCVYAGDGLVTGDTVHDMYMYCTWWLTVLDRCMKSKLRLSRFTMRTGKKNWLELWRNWWSANPPVISMLSHSAFFPALCYQDMDKGERKNRGLVFQNVEKVQRLLKFTGMSDYQNIGESTALCSLVACTSIHSTHVDFSHPWSPSMTDSSDWNRSTVRVGAFLYKCAYFKYLEGDVYVSNFKLVVTFFTEFSHVFANISIVLFQCCSTLLHIC